MEEMDQTMVETTEETAIDPIETEEEVEYDSFDDYNPMPAIGLGVVIGGAAVYGLSKAIPAAKKGIAKAKDKITAKLEEKKQAKAAKAKAESFVIEDNKDEN